MSEPALEHPESSSPLSEHASKVDDPDRDDTANPPPGPALQEVRGDPALIVGPSSAKAKESPKAAKDE